MTHAHATLNCPVDKDNKYPFHVKIVRQVPGDKFYCTGEIIQKCYILTAAHCLVMGSKDRKTVGHPSEFGILSGINSEVQMAPAMAVYPHPRYHGSNDSNSKQ